MLILVIGNKERVRVEGIDFECLKMSTCFHLISERIMCMKTIINRKDYVIILHNAFPCGCV